MFHDEWRHRLTPSPWKPSPCLRCSELIALRTKNIAQLYEQFCRQLKIREQRFRFQNESYWMWSSSWSLQEKYRVEARISKQRSWRDKLSQRKQSSGYGQAKRLSERISGTGIVTFYYEHTSTVNDVIIHDDVIIKALLTNKIPIIAPNGRCGYFSDTTDHYQLDDSNINELDDRPFPLFHISFTASELSTNYRVNSENNW